MSASCYESWSVSKFECTPIDPMCLVDDRQRSQYLCAVHVGPQALAVVVVPTLACMRCSLDCSLYRKRFATSPLWQLFHSFFSIFGGPLPKTYPTSFFTHSQEISKFPALRVQCADSAVCVDHI